MERRFVDWLATIDPALRKAIAAPPVWVIITITNGLALWAANAAPGASELFHLDGMTAFLTYLPVLAVGFCLGMAERAGVLSLRAFGLIAILGAALFQYFMWSLVTLSQPKGASLMAVFPVLLASFHGQVLRSAPRYPFIALGVMCAATASYLQFGSAEHLPILAVAVPAAVGTSLIVGQIGLGSHETQLHAMALRDAIDAQAMHESMAESALFRELLLLEQSRHHDVGNALSGVLVTAERLAVLVSKSDKRATEHDLGSDADLAVRSAALTLLSGLGRLRSLLEDGRHAARSSAGMFETVDLSDVLQLVIGDVQRTNPAVQVRSDCEQDASLPHSRVSVCGGQATLHRVLTNLMLNACQGDGVQRARCVAVGLSRSEPGNGAITLTIEDDGPGFPPALLSAPLRAFHTTKPRGTGLGLYTCDRLVRASGGRLELAARSDGPGARVAVTLRREGAR